MPDSSFSIQLTTKPENKKTYSPMVTIGSLGKQKLLEMDLKIELDQTFNSASEDAKADTFMCHSTMLYPLLEETASSLDGFTIVVKAIQYVFHKTWGERPMAK